MRMIPCLGAIALVTVASTGDAQAPHALPARIVASIGIPGASPARFANVSLVPGALPWTLDGCTAGVPNACRETQRVALSDADRRELVVVLEAVASVGRCEPEGFVPGDPPYTLEFPSAHYAGYLPADPAAIASRTGGPCGAPARLAWWLARRFTR